jgi:hypothetical protein
MRISLEHAPKRSESGMDRPSNVLTLFSFCFFFVKSHFGVVSQFEKDFSRALGICLNRLTAVFSGREGSDMPDHFDQFIHDENIRLLNERIEAETDPERLKVLMALLRDEQAKAPSYTRAPSGNPARPSN